MNWQKSFAAYLKAITLAVIVVGGANATADCSPELASALRTRYSIDDKSTLAESVEKLACSSSSRNDSGGIVYEEFALNYSGGSTSSACAREDHQFFQRNNVQIALSYLPDEALRVLQTCSGGMTFTAKQSSDGSLVVIRMAYININESSQPELKELVYDRDLLQCTNPPTPGTTIPPGGITVSCKRLISSRDISIILNSSFGAPPPIFISRTPVIKIKPRIWDHYVGGRLDDLYRCKDLTNGAVPYGDFVNCHTADTCGKGEGDSGYCASKYGSQYVEIDNNWVRNLPVK